MLPQHIKRTAMINITERTNNAIVHGALAMAVVALGMLLATTTYGQDETAAGGMEHAFGVKGGLNYSTLYVEEAKDVNARTGFHVGLFGRVAPTGGLGFQVEALYDQKGVTVKKAVGTIDQETTFKFDYIDVPLLIIIPLGEVAELQGGAYLGGMVVSERSTDGDLGSGSSDPSDAKFNMFDYGLVGGFGINLGMAQVGVRYNHGLNDIATDDVSRNVLGNSKNAYAQAYIALALGKGDK